MTRSEAPIIKQFTTEGGELFDDDMTPYGVGVRLIPGRPLGSSWTLAGFSMGGLTGSLWLE